MDIRKINLYEIDEQMRQILDSATIDEETGEFKGDLEQLTALEMTEDAKIESLALYIQELEATAPAIKAEADRLYAKHKHYQRLAEGYTKYLDGYFNKYCERRRVSKYKSNLVTIGYRHSKETHIIDEAKAYESANSLGLVAVETKYIFDKRGLKDYILEHPNESVSGVAVIDKQKINIK